MRVLSAILIVIGILIFAGWISTNFDNPEQFIMGILKMENRANAIVHIMFIVHWVIIGLMIWYYDSLRVDNIAKNKKVEELQKYKCAWEDFNRSYIPETALPRINEIEDIYLKG